MDTFDTQQRSKVMAAVRSKNTVPEVLVRRILHRLGYRFRLHLANLPGKPDIVFQSRRKVIFVHGCFWHGHDCKRGARTPAANRAYWVGKIERNRQRYATQGRALAALGWATLTIWECETKNIQLLESRLKAFLGDTKK